MYTLKNSCYSAKRVDDNVVVDASRRAKQRIVSPVGDKVASLQSKRRQTVIKQQGEPKFVDSKWENECPRAVVTLLDSRVEIQDKPLIHALQKPLPAGQCRALLIWRLEDFRDLKTIFGTTVADALQLRIAERLQHSLSIDDVIVQIAEDEFGIVVNLAYSYHHLSRIAQRLIDRCSGMYVLEEECLHINASLGIACYARDSSDPEELIRFARLALRQQQVQRATPYHFFSQEQYVQQKHRLRMIVELEQAIEQNRLRLHYQPQYAMDDDKRVIGFEALVRMENEHGQLISPDRFIPLAEENGMIIAIGRWVIREACQQLKRWHLEGFRHLRMAVNVSPRQLLDDHLIDLVTQAVLENDIDYQDLELEITEQCLLENAAVAENVLNKLSQKGVRIALDDFGTGYSSLAYLTRFPLNSIKMDRSFLIHAPEELRSRQIILAILAMAEQLGLEVVAEGIETDEHHQFLVEAGCPIGQGFGLSEPKSAESLKWLFDH